MQDEEFPMWDCSTSSTRLKGQRIWSRRSQCLPTCSGHHPGEELLKKLASASEAALESFSSQNISNTAMAFAKLEFHPGTLMQRICRATLSNLATFTPQVTLVTHRSPLLCVSPSIDSPALQLRLLSFNPGILRTAQWARNAFACTISCLAGLNTLCWRR